jgi:hypothetical protein
MHTKHECGEMFLGNKTLEHERIKTLFTLCWDSTILYINSLRLSNGGFGGWGRERPVKQQVTGVSLWWGWTTTVSVYKSFPQIIAAIQRVGMTVGSHPYPTAPDAVKKTLPPPPPPPPHYRKNRRLYRGVCFWKFPKLSGTKVQNVRTEVLGFLTLGKGVNTRTDNLKVHMAGSNTHTTSVGTTMRSRWLEWRSHGCPKVTGTTSE